MHGTAVHPRYQRESPRQALGGRASPGCVRQRCGLPGRVPVTVRKRILGCRMSLGAASAATHLLTPTPRLQTAGGFPPSGSQGSSCSCGRCLLPPPVTSLLVSSGLLGTIPSDPPGLRIHQCKPWVWFLALSLSPCCCKCVSLLPTSPLGLVFCLCLAAPRGPGLLSPRVPVHTQCLWRATSSIFP